ncbi:multidrug resistance secretion protein [Klebsiella pneumoniae]|uniref:Multidrug resistance secretion protein n=1 Tax=Klebsiella pneumoniae TaxID=573 RepID=A0A378FN84_KLEPN|nr:multidrug resistance secretion protein [Klebsiella pneumoniae]
MAVVPATNLWIDANFKETQLAHMRIGQPATVIAISMAMT